MAKYGNLGYGSGGYGTDGGPVGSLPLSYYLGLLTSEYRLAPNLNAWLAFELSLLDDTTNALMTFDAAFDLDLAVGAQLDIIGQQVGQGRQVAFQPTGGVSSVLDDITYRLLLRATIAQNHWDGTIGTLYGIWQTLFPGGTIRLIDNQNMSATVVMSGAFTGIAQDLITHGYIVPRPQGVQYNFTFGELPIFGYDENNSFIAGFDLGHWS